MSKYYQLLNKPLLLAKKQFIINYINILDKEYNSNRVLLINLINSKKDIINPIFFKKYHYYNDYIIKQELEKHKDIAILYNKQVEMNDLVNIGYIILRNDLRKN